MTILFGRRWKLTIGDVDVSALDIQFDVTKNTRSEPNTLEARVFNLARDTRARIEDADEPQVVLRAGYHTDGDPPPRLYSGAARRLYTQREGYDLITTIQSRDRGRELQTARISRSYGPGSRASRVLRDTVEALGIGEGNLNEFEGAFSTRTGSTEFPDGFVADGPARRILQTLTRAAGLRWSVQNGNLQLQRAGAALQTQALRLSASTGLIGTPTRNYSGNTRAERRKVTIQTLIIAGMEPGRRVVLDAENIQGTYELRQVVYKGDTRGNDWYINAELMPVA